VGNLSYNTDDESLRKAFEAYGEVSSAQVVVDRETGKSRGFGFVEMPDQTAAEEAIKALNGSDLDGRNVSVNQARPKAERTDRGGRGGGGGGRGRW
ncbi:MAG TPA: RNA-binding protein, partial [Planctomycetota bacterium]|nr:RNA-binding protein [Planctomycetota bacterium]